MIDGCTIYNADVTANDGRVRMWLRPALYQCPRSWFMFIEDLSRRKGSPLIGHRIDQINQELEIYRGTYVDLGEDREGWVDFETEADYTYFLMMYS